MTKTRATEKYESVQESRPSSFWVISVLFFKVFFVAKMAYMRRIV